MKTVIGRVLTGVVLCVSVSMGAGKAVAGGGSGSENLVRTAMQSRVMIQKVVKDYLYAGNDVATAKAQREMKKSLEQYDKALVSLNDSINDPKMKNLLLFLESNREEMGDLLAEEYNLDTAQEIIDLAEAISEGGMSIARKLQLKNKAGTSLLGGQRYYITQVAKYYIAYRAGIKDKITVKNMNKAVAVLSKKIQEMKAYSENTPKMNQIMNKIDKDWRIVKQFYTDIEEGDLPLIVYDTTHKIERGFSRYLKAGKQHKIASK